MGLATALAMTPGTFSAQIDYRNLDAGRPSRVEDAYAVESGALELLLGQEVAFQDGAVRRAVTPEITWGLLPNVHAGVAGSVVTRDIGNTTALAGLGLFALRNFNTENLALPALSVRGDWLVPAGGFGPRAARGAVTAIATRSFGLTRLHANAGAGLGPREAGGEEEIARWSWGIAWDRTLFRSSVLLVADVAWEERATDGATAVAVGFGLRWQAGPAWVLDFGARRRVTRAGPDLALAVGLTTIWGMPPW